MDPTPVLTPPTIDIPGVPSITVETPADLAQLPETKSMAFYEDNLKQGEQVISFNINSADGKIPTSVIGNFPDDGNNEKPFDVELRGLVNSNGITTATLAFTDNENLYNPGDIFTMGIQAVQGAQEAWYNGAPVGNLGTTGEHIGTPVLVKIEYNAGTKEGYFLNDGVCESDLGENNKNSSKDCPSELEKLVDFSCLNLPQAENADIRIYRVTPTDNSFTVAENMELALDDPRSEKDYACHLIAPGQTNPKSYIVAVGGIGNNTASMSSGNNSYGFNPKECPRTYIFNPNKEDIPNGETWTLKSMGSFAMSEEIRGSANASPEVPLD